MSVWKILKFATKAKTAPRRAWNWFKDNYEFQAGLLFLFTLSLCVVFSYLHQRHKKAQGLEWRDGEWRELVETPATITPRQEKNEQVIIIDE